MAVITPNTDLYLLKVPLEINDINQLDFANATAQYNYFNSLPKLTVDDFTYQRKDNVIRFPAQFDEIITYNYCMYRNTEYSDKWFYAFITNMEYVNDNMTSITIKTDVWQTWQFDLNFKPCLIDREHTNDDTVGSNTLPEGLELGEMVTNGAVINFGGGSDYCVVVEVSQIENTGESATLSYTWASGTHDPTPELNDISRGTIPLVIGLITGGVSSPDSVVRVYDKAGLGKAIVNVYMLPKKLVGTYNELSLTARVDDGLGGYDSLTITGLAVPVFKAGVYDLGTYNFIKPTNLANYIPKNNKLLTFPYCYFNISNSSGASVPFHYEDFSTSNVEFKTEGTFGLTGQTKAIPRSYKYITNSENALDYSISGGKFPVCSWESDSYTNWLTQNAVNMQTEWRTAIIGGALGIGTNAYQGGMAGAGVSGVGAVGGAIGAGAVATAGVVGGFIQLAREQHLAKTQANLVPDQTRGNLGAGDFLWAKYKTPFTFIPMSIKPEYARCIDEFFNQFGYKCNRVKRPNITGRRNWNYVKTVGCYIEADIPQEDLQEIKNMFDNGITIWHNPIQFANYGADNDII